MSDQYATEDQLRARIAELEGRLAASEERFEQVAQNIDEVLYLYDPGADRFLYVSAAYERIWEMDVQSVMQDARAFTRVVHPDDLKAFREGIRQELEERRYFNLEYRIVMPDGRIKWIWARSFPVQSAEAAPDRTVGIAVEITGRRRAEAALRQSQAALVEAQAVAKIGSWSYDVATDTPAWSDEMYRIFGRDPALGPPAWKEHRPYVHPADWERLDETVRAGWETGEPYRTEFRLVHQGKTTLWAETIGHVHRDASDAVVRLSGTVQDITEHKRITNALKQSEERLLALFGATPEYIMLLDPEHRVQMINRVATGVSPDLVLGKQPHLMAPSAERERIKTHLDRVIREGTTEKYHTSLEHPELPTRHFSAVSAPVVVDDEVVGSVVSARDVTDRLRLAREKQQLEDQYRQAHKMEAVGRLAGGVAHDFNNLLTVITNYASFVLEGLRGADPLRADVEQILEAGNQASILTRQLLAFSRKQVMAPRVLQLNGIVAGLQRLLGRLIGEDIHLRTELAEGLHPVRADEGQVEQILMNLAVNARDAMPDGGELTLRTSNVVLPEDHPVVGVDFAAGECVKLAVSDTGSGMTDEVQERIFEPFYTTKEKGRGTGLGLATVYGIVKQSRGTIRVESEPGQGAVFNIYWPRTADESPAVEAAQPDAPKQGGVEHILVVEDEDAVRRLTARMLRRAGYEVTTAANGGEALLALEQSGQSFQLLLTDVVMPNMSGKELVERLAGFYPGLRVLYMSGYTDDAIAHHGVLDESIRLLNKPFSGQELLQHVRAALDDEPLDVS